jgi:hypothetical protein
VEDSRWRGRIGAVNIVKTGTGPRAFSGVTRSSGYSVDVSAAVLSAWPMIRRTVTGTRPSIS